jgi:hypothetical protein
LDSLLGEFLTTAPRVEPVLVARLAAVARGRQSAGWPLRRCAALMLEHLFWACASREDEAVILSHLGPARRTIDAGELRRRIARNARVHAGLRGPETSPAALADFLHLATQESRLALMRWLVTADEVIARIGGAMRGSRAVIQPLSELPWIAAEADRVLAALPEWERRIAGTLAAAPQALWVSTADSSGDLVQCPAGTVVATVKPPGSDLEIEIKRAGRPNPRPLAVVWERDGVPVPPSHRLDAGSTWSMLRWEAASAARLSEVWRALHGEEAPLCRVLAIKAVFAVPDGERELPVLDFFAQEAAQPALARVVAEVCAERGEEAPDLPGEVALAARFLLQCQPAQSVILGTSAHRLDKLAAALAEGRKKGQQGLQRLQESQERRQKGSLSVPAVSFSCPPARHTLALLLDEALGLFTPPPLPFTDPASWLDAAFAANRERADTCHRAAAERLGALWGTFLALGAHSSGESVVGRNVGLKAVFRGGEWRVELISMDHDNLHVAWSEDVELDPAFVLAANVKDEIALLGGPYKGAQVRGSLELLGDLYRASEAGRMAARSFFFAAARQAFTRSAAALEPGGAAAGLFAPAFLEELSRWRQAVAEFLAHGAAPEDRPAWIPILNRYAGFLWRQAGVYLGEERER